MGGSKIIKEERVSTAGKNAEGKAWYKNRIDLLDTNSTKDFVGINGLSEAERMQINFDLFNNVLPPGDLDKVCGDFLSVGDLPAELVNQDILSNKIKVVVGLEMRSPFECAIVATNPEATTRKETKENDLLKEFVINKIMLPIRQEQEAKMMQETQGRELSEQETQELQARMEE